MQRHLFFYLSLIRSEKKVEIYTKIGQPKGDNTTHCLCVWEKTNVFGKMEGRCVFRSQPVKSLYMHEGKTVYSISLYSELNCFSITHIPGRGTIIAAVLNPLKLKKIDNYVFFQDSFPFEWKTPCLHVYLESNLFMEKKSH